MNAQVFLWSEWMCMDMRVWIEWLCKYVREWRDGWAATKGSEAMDDGMNMAQQQSERMGGRRGSISKLWATSLWQI
jgi:hypothetical protein